MKAIVAILAVCLLGQKVHAWGGLFNRFSPEMLANMGYGGHGGFIQVIKFIYNLLISFYFIFINNKILCCQ